MFYSKYLGKTLTKAFEDALGNTPHERLQVYEELALIRVVARESVTMYGAAQDLPLDNPNRDKLLVSAGENMRVALQEVIKTCATASQIEAQQKDKISIAAIKSLVDQIILVAYDVMGDENLELAKLFEFEIRNRVRLPRQDNDIETKKELLAALLSEVENERNANVVDAEYIERLAAPETNERDNGHSS